LNTLLLLFALCHLALLAWTFAGAGRGALPLWLLRCLLFGVFWDNLVQGTGGWFVDQPWYLPANYLRYFLHSLLLPLLVLFGLWAMGGAGAAAAASPRVRVVCYVFTLGAIAWGLYHEVFLLQLAPVSVLGVDKLVAVFTAPPYATIATSLVLLTMGVAVWRASGWRWLFLGSLFIFVVNGATASLPWGFVAASFAEVVFILCLLATERRFIGQPEEPVT
jgi:hypothetical protein